MAELVEVLPAAARIGWFLVGLLGTVFVGWYLLDPAVSRAVRKRNPQNPTIREYVDCFGGDAITIRVHYWIHDPRERDVFAVRSAFARMAKHRLEDAGITISPSSKRELEGRTEVTELNGEHSISDER